MRSIARQIKVNCSRVSATKAFSIKASTTLLAIPETLREPGRLAASDPKCRPHALARRQAEAEARGHDVIVEIVEAPLILRRIDNAVARFDAEKLQVLMNGAVCGSRALSKSRNSISNGLPSGSVKSVPARLHPASEKSCDARRKSSRSWPEPSDTGGT